MNKKETIQAVKLLDECIDSTEWLEAMLVLDALRRTLLQLWQRCCCQAVDGQALLAELSSLPELCREAALHPALPLKLCQAMFILCTPEMEPGRDIGLQCREQAGRIRRLRRWRQEMSALLVRYDEQTRQEMQSLQAEKLEMMSEVFMHFLAIYRAGIAKAAAEKRSARLREIGKLREALSLEDIADAAVRSRTNSEMTKEKLSEFAAEIAASDLLNAVKGLHPQPEELASGQAILSGQAEEEA